MTPAKIREYLHHNFCVAYPMSDPSLIEVIGAGRELITVDIWLTRSMTDSITWECETASDDDGYFHFRHDDLEIVIPYPRGM